MNILLVAKQAVSLYAQPATSPYTRLDYHLVHTLIHRGLCLRTQSRGFPRQPRPILSLFCSKGFRRIDSAVAIGHRPSTASSAHTTKAGYTAPSFQPDAGFPRDFSRSLPRWGQFPHAAGCLTPLTSTSTPNWASKADTRIFIDVPRDGFLGPPSELVRLTRILQPPPIILNLRL